MKARRRTLCIVAAGALLFGVAAGLHAWLAPRLPRIKLKNGGGELRVFAVRYGMGDEQRFFSEPKWKFKVWEALPKRLQSHIPEPYRGPYGEFSYEPAATIWCAWIDPETHQPEPTEFKELTVTLDNGEALPYEPPSDPAMPYLTQDWPIGADAHREIMIVHPPADSRYLRVAFRVWGNDEGELVHFTVENPAYRQP